MNNYQHFKSLIEHCRLEPAMAEVLQGLAEGAGPVVVGGLAGSQQQVFQAILAEGRQTLLLVENLNDAEIIRDDLQVLLGERHPAAFTRRVQALVRASLGLS